MATQPAPSSAVSPKTVEKAVNSLLKWRDSKSKAEKPQLLEEDEFVYLILTLKKIPQKGVSRTSAHKVPLPHPLMDPHRENNEFCLIIDDRPKTNLAKDEVKKKIQNDNIPISKIIKLSKLKSDYRPFEAKRKLCDSYNMFFADRRVIPLLPKMLGKQFFKKKKIPVAVDLKHKNWKEQIERACGSALLFLRSGTCSVVKVGRVSMGKEEIVENVTAAINGIAEIVPRKWGGIRSLHLKLLESLALPIYQALPDLKLKIEAAKEDGDGEVEKETVKEETTGQKKKTKKKGRIHEVRYMDSIANDGDNLDEDVSDDGGIIDEDNDNVELGSEELQGKKRKKGEKGKVKKLKETDAISGNVIKQKKEKDQAKTGGSIERKKQRKEESALENIEVKEKEVKKKKKRLVA